MGFASSEDSAPSPRVNVAGLLSKETLAWERGLVLMPMMSPP
jgi:hypothetical protein